MANLTSIVDQNAHVLAYTTFGRQKAGTWWAAVENKRRTSRRGERVLAADAYYVPLYCHVFEAPFPAGEPVIRRTVYPYQYWGGAASRTVGCAPDTSLKQK